MIALGSATDTRLGAYAHAEDLMIRSVQEEEPDRKGRVRTMLSSIPRWMVRGYQRANATDLASAVAFQALVAIVPMFLLLISVAGLFLQDSRVLEQAIIAIAVVLPSSASGDAFTAAFEARRNSGLFGALSLLGFAWVGTGFVSAMARSMNRIYGVPNAGYLKEKQRGFIVILLFALFFLIATSAAVVTTLFVGNQERLPLFFRGWVFASSQGQVIGYVVAVLAAFFMFITIYRLVPNAGQRMMDVWPGALLSLVLFLGVTQVFPIYLRVLGGANRYGVVFGLISLMVVAFYAIAHVILFGAYVNATWQHHRRETERRRKRGNRDDDSGDGVNRLYVPPDIQAARAGMMEQPIR